MKASLIIRTGFIIIYMWANLEASAQHQHEKGDTTGRTEHNRMKQDSLQKINPNQMESRSSDIRNMERMENTGMQNMQMDMNIPMTHAFSLNLPMTRNGSGTAWLPDASPMYGVMLHSKKWMYMLHGNIDLRYTKQDLTNKRSRGDDKFDAPNWFMAMAQRKVGENGLFHWNAMISLDPLTEGGFGYPLLFQSGESWNGTPFDRPAASA